MIETQWRTGTDPAPLLEALSGWPNERKLRLFACDCCRRLSHLMSGLDHAVVNAIERCAEGLIPAAEIYTSAGFSQPVPPYTYGWGPGVQRIIREAASPHAWSGARRARAFVVDAVRKEEGSEGRIAEWKRQSDVIRCIVGNPFRRVSFLSQWRTDTVLVLARQMYESREFSAMPILADALQDAGCDDDEILNHCRADSPHARGCWVVDLVLGKT